MLGNPGVIAADDHGHVARRLDAGARYVGRERGRSQRERVADAVTRERGTRVNVNFSRRVLGIISIADLIDREALFVQGIRDLVAEPSDAAPVAHLDVNVGGPNRRHRGATGLASGGDRIEEEFVHEQRFARIVGNQHVPATAQILVAGKRHLVHLDRFEIDVVHRHRDAERFAIAHVGDHVAAHDADQGVEMRQIVKLIVRKFVEDDAHHLLLAFDPARVAAGVVPEAAV
jgi:hypothetical protein